MARRRITITTNDENAPVRRSNLTVQRVIEMFLMVLGIIFLLKLLAGSPVPQTRVEQAPRYYHR